MNGVEGISDVVMHTLFAVVIAWMLCIRERKMEILALSLLPMLMDADHLLPLYFEGMKAFHSLIFIYLISGSVLAYGYLKNSDKAKRMGAISFAILIFSLSLDLLEGGKISFLYPLSTQTYALPYYGVSEASKFAVLGVLIFVIAVVYQYEMSLEDFRIPRPRHGKMWSQWKEMRVGLKKPFARVALPVGIGSESILKTSLSLTLMLIGYIWILYLGTSL